MEVEDIETGDFKMEDIPKWITHYGFAVILFLLILIPILLFNYEYSIKIEGDLRGAFGDKIIISLKGIKDSQLKLSQKITFNLNEKRMIGVISRIDRLNLGNSLDEVEVSVSQIREDKENRPLKKNTIIIDEGPLFYKVFDLL
jgi:hypothetical protein